MQNFRTVVFGKHIDIPPVNFTQTRWEPRASESHNFSIKDKRSWTPAWTLRGGNIVFDYQFLG